MKKNKNKNKMILYFLVCIVILIVAIELGNNWIEVTTIEFLHDEVPASFDGFKIIHVSDLHNKTMGKNQAYLLETIKNETPDVIVITGDLVDRRKFDLEAAMTFVNGAVDIAPVYYVSGNHEAWSGQYDRIRSELIQSGVVVLDDTRVVWTKDGEAIDFVGVMDPDFYTSSYIDGTDSQHIKKTLEAEFSPKRFQVLLSHRPELMSIYSDNMMDLVFSGHAHGGQFRLPIIGGLVAPDQGFFPKYTSGIYKEMNTALVVSRGLGNSIIPVRIFNRPQLIVVTLKSVNE